MPSSAVWSQERSWNSPPASAHSTMVRSATQPLAVQQAPVGVIQGSGRQPVPSPRYVPPHGDPGPTLQTPAAQQAPFRASARLWGAARAIAKVAPEPIACPLLSNRWPKMPHPEPHW